MKTQIKPQSIKKTNDNQLYIQWNNQKESFYNLKKLRFACPCARCIDEWTGNKLIHLKSIDDSVKPVRIYSVGLYALAIDWSDSHKSGIYSYSYLHSL